VLLVVAAVLLTAPLSSAIAATSPLPLLVYAFRPSTQLPSRLVLANSDGTIIRQLEA